MEIKLMHCKSQKVAFKQRRRRKKKSKINLKPAVAQEFNSEQRTIRHEKKNHKCQINQLLISHTKEN
jgi:hypothetical protein